MTIREKKITLPTLVTLLRILLVPFIVKAIFEHQWGTAFVLFLIAAVTDTIDGNLARFLGEQTLFGAVLDPVADKFLLLSCFLALSLAPSSFIIIPQWFFFFILGKELVIMLGALAIYLIKGSFAVRPTKLAKFTTLVQMGFILWFFLCSHFYWLPIKTFYGLLFLILLLAFGSLLQYILVGLRLLFGFLL